MLDEDAIRPLLLLSLLFGETLAFFGLWFELATRLRIAELGLPLFRLDPTIPVLFDKSLLPLYRPLPEFPPLLFA